MKRILRDLPHYVILFSIFVTAIAIFMFFPNDRILQVAVASATAISYVIWGVVHHMLHEDLYPEVVIEYTLIAILGLVVVLSLIFRV